MSFCNESLPTENPVVFQPENEDEKYLNRILPEDFPERIRMGKWNRQLYPSCSDRRSWENLLSHPEKKEICREITAAADALLQIPPPSITYSDFCQFIKDGNRWNYEKKNYERRAGLARLALALCITNDQKKYMPALLDYLYAILSEPRWCFPAHSQWKDGVLQEKCMADLFACETCAQMGLFVNVLGPELESAAPGILQEIRRKVFDSSMGILLSPETTRLNHWYYGGCTNWTTWCGYNMLVTAVCFEPDNAKLAEYVQILLYPFSRFITHYSDDGYCLEGPSYFSFSAGMVYRMGELFEKMMPGSMTAFFAVPKHRAMFEFIAGTVTGRDFVAYSDASRRDKHPYYLANSIAARFNNPLAASIFRGQKNTEMIGELGRDFSDNLNLLFDFPEVLPEANAEKKDVWFYRNHLAVMHSAAFSVALKAGNNGEPHNHNDLGNFTLYAGNTPVVIDAGTACYAAINFSDKRYTLWYTRGNGHNAPVINGVEQEADAKYEAALTVPENRLRKTAVCDLSRAYPEKAGVKKLIRTVSISDETVEIQDSLETAEGYPAEMKINLIFLGKPESQKDKIFSDSTVLSMEGWKLDRIELQEESFNEWPAPVYRAVLRSTAPRCKMIFSAGKN